MVSPGVRVTVLENDLELREPSAEEAADYAEFLGIDPVKEPHLMWIARKGVVAPVPEPWKACTENGDDVFYFNFETAESVWDHPSDETFRQMVQEYRAKGPGGQPPEANEAGGAAAVPADSSPPAARRAAPSMQTIVEQLSSSSGLTAGDSDTDEKAPEKVKKDAGNKEPEKTPQASNGGAVPSAQPKAAAVTATAGGAEAGAGAAPSAASVQTPRGSAGVGIAGASAVPKASAGAGSAIAGKEDEKEASISASASAGPSPTGQRAAAKAGSPNLNGFVASRGSGGSRDASEVSEEIVSEFSISSPSLQEHKAPGKAGQDTLELSASAGAASAGAASAGGASAAGAATNGASTASAPGAQAVAKAAAPSPSAAAQPQAQAKAAPVAATAVPAATVSAAAVPAAAVATAAAVPAAAVATAAAVPAAAVASAATATSGGGTHPLILEVQSLTRSLAMLKEIREKQQDFIRLLQANA
eukprot:TRINITY_DN2498_c0_g1_i1.p1 TRINITY_DN2498_c0_g1~~TRINITY_DN2498_c0_g1_i1.p1  ORF type:complete len:518 (-),score=128.82 TRINITY_DN2498_c0_g1_i1:63-1484(-)